MIQHVARVKTLGRGKVILETIHLGNVVLRGLVRLIQIIREITPETANGSINITIAIPSREMICFTFVSIFKETKPENVSEMKIWVYRQSCHWTSEL